MVTLSETIAEEIEWRKALLEEIGGQVINNNVDPRLLREWGIYGGQQGIWIDKARTGKLAGNDHGLAVSLLHKGNIYPDDFDETGVIYHYPSTRRPAARDFGEIMSVKNLREHDVPLFVIKVSDQDRGKRDVYFGYVTEWDDKAEAFIVEFGVTTPPLVKPDEDFHLFDEHTTISESLIERPSRASFRIKVFRRYGIQCAVCDMQVVELLDAAHIVPKSARGTDDPRNGLPLCALHHRAFDKGLFAIDPTTTSIIIEQIGYSPDTLKITKHDLTHMNNQPHEYALHYAWERWNSQQR